jgi:hypothetical protein
MIIEVMMILSGDGQGHSNVDGDDDVDGDADGDGDGDGFSTAIVTHVVLGGEGEAVVKLLLHGCDTVVTLL